MDRLNAKFREYIRARGIDGKADVCKATKRGMRTVERWAEVENSIPETLRYDVAVTIGCTHEEALELAQEGCPSQGKAS